MHKEGRIHVFREYGCAFFCLTIKSVLHKQNYIFIAGLKTSK